MSPAASAPGRRTDGRRRRLAVAACRLIVALPVALSAQAASPSSPNGPALVAELRAARPAENLEVQGWIRRRDAQGRRTAAPFVYRTVVGPDSWQTIYETPGGPEIAAQKLRVTHQEGRPPHYELQPAPADPAKPPPPHPITGSAAMIPFADSDFWLADLGLEFYHWTEHRIVDEAKITMRKGRPCHVLESRNPAPAAQGYTRVLSWIDRETGKPILAEAYAANGKRIKEFEIGGVTKVNGVYELKNMEMRDLQRDSRTVLEFRYEQRDADLKSK
jgi:hypothetical protein